MVWAMLSKSLIQFSADGWDSVPSLRFDLRPNYGGGNEDNSDLLQKVPACTQEMGIPEHLTCLLRNLYAGQEARVRTGHGPTDWFQIGK